MVANDLLTAEKTAELLGIKTQTLAVWRLHRKHIPFCRVGRSIRYLRSDVEKFIENRVVSPKQN